ncbi:MAG: ribonuclease H-like domain-containing protein [Verrucomicrobiae bacterium]|nr:ribonuclease H-like domain-containing protein [Verrucomicrobiae bacterium]
MKNIVYFDLETQKSLQQVGGYSKIHDLRLSLAVTYNTLDHQYKIYLEEDVSQLISDLSRASLVVGYNLLNFDYRVLSAYSVLDLSQIPTLDMMVEIEKTLGMRLKLDSIAQATLGVGKTAEGMDALKWFQQERWSDIAEYCCYDVKVTRLLHEFAQTHKQLFYLERASGQRRAIQAVW